MDRKQESEFEKKVKREREVKEERKQDKSRELEEARGPRKIKPLWFAAVGLVLALLALIYWTFFLSSGLR